MISDRYGDKKSPLEIERAPSLNALRCFAVAARFENFTHAAEALCLTHGAVSRAVRALEDELGVKLFERRSRRVFLTLEGKALARAVDEGLAVIHQATETLRASARQPRPLVLSCEPTLLMRWLLPRWPDFQARYPQARIHLVAGGGAFSARDGIDLAIRRNDFDWPEGWQAERLFPEKVGPVCRPDKAREWFLSEGRISPHAPSLHTHTRPQAWHEWEQASGQTCPSGPALFFDHFYFSLQAAVVGLGVAVGPWQLVRDDIDGGMLVAPQGFVNDGSGYYLLSLSASPVAGVGHELCEWLREIARQG
ncbi:LysR family transcriptional regulator [Entomohabitans teleogrylli]|uniref:LysR family transcriptional regulator n=1 Tax=Entomohabitans teleogrylli TaxID=1384589 RepID=UPI00073D84AF|nr:LysR family transcriptional regulator [Entomohabitans teleogrylli]